MIANGLARYAINIANIPWTVSRHELRLYFSQFGCVTDAFVGFDKKTGIHQHYGYVTFLKTEDVNSVLERKHSLEGKDLVVSRKK
ncbi:SRA stem-loop-interacting RNA-binding protein, mitochondrial-like [Temnothorax curvispinosus]|uniref:SRA stem-loop-interacting RNA-binding protein, mitochondrial-like n=1 Tax=Temnothorax curvispinosus TaxID=300111 RepID=A0A6J1QUD0_9HYME|nr:SRA stem-loop-interacting RNA-binding protein, mitochondrial-like [Temnothorax curvispinosus]